MEASHTWYFAYGSNLNMGQMMTRVGEWIVCRRAVAKGYKLVFNFQSRRWGGYAANLIKTDKIDDSVDGAIYRIPKETLDVLTQYEDRKPEEILVDADGIPIRAKVYIFPASEKPGNPPDAYLQVMLVGLRQHGHPEQAIERVRKSAGSH
jgi:cation transport regulator ChaC